MEFIVPRELRVSHSEAEAFAMCERKHFYGYGKRLRKKNDSVALDTGTLGHSILAKYFQVAAILGWDQADIVDVYVPEINWALKHGTDFAVVEKLPRIFQAFKTQDPFRGRYDILVVEGSFSVKMSDDFYFAPFIIDLIIRDRKTRKIYVVDHKFQKDFLKPWHLDILPQVVKYIGALRALGYEIEGGYYHVLRKGYAVKAADRDIIQFVSIDPPDARVQNAFKDHIKAAQKIRALRALPLDEWEQQVIRVSNNMVCDKCPFKEICVADLNGHASRLLIGTTYEVKDDEKDFVMEVDDVGE